MGGHRMFKAAAVLVTLGYCSFLAYQSGVSINESANTVQNILIEPVTVTNIESLSKSNLVRSVQQNVTLDDIFISVKTSRHYQYTRLPIILKTWFQLAKDQTWFFTDINNEQHQNHTNGHMVNTHCGSTYQRRDLCCKTNVEYDTYLDSNKKWWCHFDDDNYVNVPRLVVMLQQYDHQQDKYLGKTSIPKPVKLYPYKKKKPLPRFWFATGGAGFCISRSLALKMEPSASGGKFVSMCDKICLPDDVTLGYIIEILTKTSLTVIPEFHSHLETMKLLSQATLRDQVSFSYKENEESWNTVEVPGFDHKVDPSRFISLHCQLFPEFEFCPR